MNCSCSHHLGHDKLELPTTCPVCDHSPLEASACVIHKASRTTVRAWLTKLKAKDAKKAAEDAAAPATPTPTPTEQPSEQPLEQPNENTTVDEADRVLDTTEGAQGGDALHTAISTSPGAENEQTSQSPSAALALVSDLGYPEESYQPLLTYHSLLEQQSPTPNPAARARPRRRTMAWEKRKRGPVIL